MKHTPGPWGIDQTEYPHADTFQCKIIAEGQQNSQIAEVYHGDINAHLIALAPEMLTMLIAAQTYLECLGERGVTHRKITELIARAKGT